MSDNMNNTDTKDNVEDIKTSNDKQVVTKDEQNGKTNNSSSSDNSHNITSNVLNSSQQLSQQSIVSSMAPVSVPMAAIPASGAPKVQQSYDSFEFFPTTNYRKWSKDFDEVQVTNKTTILRIKRDLTEFYASNMSTIHVVPEEENISRVHALIQGPIGTPYANGFFYFTIQFSADYPIKPPKVKLMTTGRGTVGFNPNLYSNGYVCLSILNTWSGPQWSPVMNLTSVLLSIQSLMNEEPYFNEPGREYLKSKSTQFKSYSRMTSNAAKYYSDVNQCSEQYNEHIRHETIRVAVLDMIEDTFDSKPMPQPLKDIMIESFKTNYYFFEDLVMNKIKELAQKETEKNFNKTNSIENNEQISPPISPLSAQSINSMIPSKKKKADEESTEEARKKFFKKQSLRFQSLLNTSNTSALGLSQSYPSKQRLSSMQAKHKLNESILPSVVPIFKTTTPQSSSQALTQTTETTTQASITMSQSMSQSIASLQLAQTPSTEHPSDKSSEQKSTESQSKPVSTDSKESKPNQSLVGELLDQMGSNSASSATNSLHSFLNSTKKPLTTGLVSHPLLQSFESHSQSIVDLEVDNLTYPLMGYKRRFQFNDYPNLLKRFQALKAKYKIADKPKTAENNCNSTETSCAEPITASTSISDSYTAIASNYMESPQGVRKVREAELNVEDIIDDADYYMGTNDEDDYDLEYESESDDQQAEENN